jgi:hypothetical protein
MKCLVSVDLAAVILKLKLSDFGETESLLAADLVLASPSSSDLPRESVPSRSRENGLCDPVKAGLTGVLRTQQTH